MLVMVHLEKKICSSSFGCWDITSFYILGCFHGNAHRGGVKQQLIQLFLSFLWMMRPNATFDQLT